MIKLCSVGGITPWLTIFIISACGTSPVKYAAEAVGEKYVTDVTKEHTRSLEKQIDLVLALTEQGIQKATEADQKINVLNANVNDGFKEVAKHNRHIRAAVRILREQVLRNKKAVDHHIGHKHPHPHRHGASKI